MEGSVSLTQRKARRGNRGKRRRQRKERRGKAKEHTTGGRDCRGWREREKETRGGGGEEMGEEETVVDEQQAVGESGMEVWVRDEVEGERKPAGRKSKVWLEGRA